MISSLSAIPFNLDALQILDSYRSRCTSALHALFVRIESPFWSCHHVLLMPMFKPNIEQDIFHSRSPPLLPDYLRCSVAVRLHAHHVQLFVGAHDGIATTVINIGHALLCLLHTAIIGAFEFALVIPWFFPSVLRGHATAQCGAQHDCQDSAHFAVPLFSPLSFLATISNVSCPGNADKCPDKWKAKNESPLINF